MRAARRWWSGLQRTELAALRERHVTRGLASTMPTFARSGQGATLTDVDGRRYIDFASGISVANVGHGHPEVLAAIHEQVDRLVHSGAPVMMPDVYVELCTRLCELAPVPAPSRALLLNSGSEAVENAVKIVRQATRRPGIVAFHSAFHGRTLMALSLTGKVHPYKQNFGPFPGDVYHVPYPSDHHDLTTDESLNALQQLFATEVAPERVAGIIVEPVQGEGGFVVPPPDFLPRLAELARRHAVPLIVDEIQTGMARTGELFAVQHSGVQPDVLLAAKALGGGLPLAAVVGRADIMDASEPGGLGGTFGGNPVACAAALAVLRVIEHEDVCARARRIGGVCMERMRSLQQRFDCVGDVRGMGAMTAMELVRGDGDPDAALTGTILGEAHQRGLVLLRAGLHDNVIRLLMPLTIGDAELANGLDILEAALEAAATGRGHSAPAAIYEVSHGD